MYPSYAKWIKSHRDLPLKLNQWCNVVVSTVYLFDLFILVIVKRCWCFDITKTLTYLLFDFLQIKVVPYTSGKI